MEELRRKRLRERELGALALGEASSLPIYQTTGASSLRRCRAWRDDEEDLPLKLAGLGGSAETSLVRSSSLRSVASESTALSPALKRLSQFGSYDSLVQSSDGGASKPGVPSLGGDPPRPRPWRRCLEAALEEPSEAEELVFQSRRGGEVSVEGQEGDPFAWRIPTLSYERKAAEDAEDFLPAIRKSQSTSSLSRGPKERPLSVHFEDQAPAKRRLLAEDPPAPREDPGHLSDSSSSSGSVVSFKSADSIKSRPRVQRPEGEGCVGRAGSEGGATDSRRSEAEGKEDDVNSIMMKYLGKE